MLTFASSASPQRALNHLTCLRLLFLHNNQIRDLDDTMHELRRMQQLQTATFFLNPISHEPGYRLHVIHSLPSVQFLDRKAFIFCAVRSEASREEEHLPDL
ncbi:leucine-rich repeat-containing protein 72 isoform X2 [Anabas testudineus]|uniref:leucine-rich repeat-containing protein 72 isoform X2 n=1 Tax=Anabas testudineus TaxID=64144 RepID=UPI000E453DC0|nr:leucine-rich repeat-containing protein 72 isoform X2 [Anabas testudineus]